MTNYNSVEIIDWLWRVLLAQGFVLLLFIAGLISFAMPMTDQVRPYFIIMAIYYWAIYRPTLLNPMLLFCMGIIFDIVLSFPIGLHAIIFLLVQWVIRNQRLFLTGQTYLVVWMGFGLTVLSVLVIEWLFFSMITLSWMGFTPTLYNFLVTVLLYPLITLLFIAMHRILPVSSHSQL